MEVKDYITKKIILKVAPVENFRSKLNLDPITVTKILKCFRTNWCRKRTKIFKMYCLGRILWTADRLQQIQKRNKQIKEKPLVERNQCIYISSSNKWKPCHRVINSRPSNFKNGTEKGYCLKWGTVYQFVRFISQFSLKIYIQILKYFHSTIIRSVCRGCFKKIRCYNSRLSRLPQCL